jgi:hypothetical protein
MDKLLIAGLLRTLSTVSTLAIGDATKSQSVSKTLAYAATLLEKGAEGEEKLKELTSELQVMVAEGRDPTSDEWDALKLRSDAAHAAIQNS